MKKLVSVIAIVLLITAVACVFTACEKGSDKLVDKYEIAESVVKMGDKHGTPTITAHMTDGTTKTVSNHLVFDEEDVEALKLDKDGKYTEAGEYTVKVYILEQQEKFALGEWKITVKAVK